MRGLKLWLLGKAAAYLLKDMRIAPLAEILSVNEAGELTISGKTLDMEKAMVLREAANMALNNKALNLIREQVVYEAFVGAAIKSAEPYDLVFYRAALWWGQQVEKHLYILAQRQQEPDL